ncbi:hypothetical protein DCAR_0103965 [Daucus carota subsp. sativus]|uniref:Uncharacterized protein n=1 Tax=Daucus carota subsp. sativus TaxID=79200 RepID=A0A166IFG6_DAUCS|nr:hypothetical protein DCAR_0103965 [Daucus carota subsp. sativus]
MDICTYNEIIFVPEQLSSDPQFIPPQHIFPTVSACLFLNPKVLDAYPFKKK